MSYPPLKLRILRPVCVRNTAGNSKYAANPCSSQLKRAQVNRIFTLAVFNSYVLKKQSVWRFPYFLFLKVVQTHHRSEGSHGFTTGKSF